MADARKVSATKAKSQSRPKGLAQTKDSQPPLAWLFDSEDDDSLAGIHQSKRERNLIRNERQEVLEYLRKRARQMPAEDAPEELLLLIESFLNSHGFPSASRILSLERTARQHTDDQAPVGANQVPGGLQLKHGLKEIYETWRRDTMSNSYSNSVQTESSDENSDVGSDKSVSGSSGLENSQVELDNQTSSTNSDSRSSSSDTESESDDNSSHNSSVSSAKSASTARKVSVSASSSTSNSEVDAVKGGSSNDEDASSQSSESDSDSGWSSSSSDSDAEHKALTSNSRTEVPKFATERIKNGAKGRADHSDSSATLQASTPTKKSAASASTSSSSNLGSSLDGQVSGPSMQSSTAPLSSLGKRKAGASKEPKVEEVAKRPKKGSNAPFQRIPSDTKIDPRLASNAYIPYDYADRAYQDLSVTRGKGFTKEKNKKKRGSYRGGMIDNTGGRSFKFED